MCLFLILCSFDQLCNLSEEAADALIASKLLLNDHPHPENYLEMAPVPTKVRIAIN